MLPIGILEGNAKTVTRGLKLWVDAAWETSYPGSGTTWNNLIASTSDGTLSGSPTFSTNNGGYFDFDGSNDYCDFGNDSAIRPTSALSVELWVKFDALTTNLRFASDWHQSGTGDRWIFYCPNTTTVWWYMRNNQNNSDGYVAYTPSMSTWYHFVGTYGDGYQTLYVNGSYHNRRTLGASLFAGAAADTVRVGKQAETGGYLNGQLPLFRLYDVCLTPDEIKQNYDALKARYI